MAQPSTSARAAARIGCVRANVDCLSDFRVASLEDLEDALGLATWPALPKKRFLDAWRRLKDGEDEAAPSSEPQRPRSAPVSAAELAAAARGPAEDGGRRRGGGGRQRANSFEKRQASRQPSGLRGPPRRRQEVAPLRLAIGRGGRVPRFTGRDNGLKS